VPGNARPDDVVRIVGDELICLLAAGREHPDRHRDQHGQVERDANRRQPHTGQLPRSVEQRVRRHSDRIPHKAQANGRRRYTASPRARPVQNVNRGWANSVIRPRSTKLSQPSSDMKEAHMKKISLESAPG